MFCGIDNIPHNIQTFTTFSLDVGILHGIFLVPHNIIMILNNIMSTPHILQGQGPIYMIVEKCIDRSRVLAQDMVIWGEGWYAGEDEKTIKKCLKKYWPGVM